jgi:hypothetical protein
MTGKAKQAAAGGTVRPGLVMAGLFALAMIPVLVTPVLPLIDFYNHLARFFVLAHAASNSLLHANYEISWSLAPDIAGDVLATPILYFVPPLIAGHLIIVAILAVLYSGVLYLNRVLTRQHSLLVAVLLLPLLYSYILNWGFASFLLGLGLAFWAAGWWLRHRHRPLFAIPVSCVLALLVFLTHGVAFALYGILVSFLEVGIFLRAPVRRWSDLAAALSRVAVQAIIPVLLFLGWRSAVEAADAVAVSMPLAPHFHNGLYRLGTILRVEEGPAIWFDIATFAIQSATALFMIWRGRFVVARIAWPVIFVSALMIAFVPIRIFGAWYINDRMPLFAAMVLLSAMSPRPGTWTRESRVACGILVTTVFVRLVVIAISWHGYGRSFQEFQSIAERIPPGSLTMGIAVGAGHHETNIPRCEMYGPLLIVQYGHAGPLFDDKNLHPVILAGGLKRSALELQKKMPVLPDEQETDFNSYMMAAASAGFDHLLICNRQLLTQPFPKGMELLAQTPHFALLRAGKP